MLSILTSPTSPLYLDTPIYIKVTPRYVPLPPPPYHCIYCMPIHRAGPYRPSAALATTRDVRTYLAPSSLGDEPRGLLHCHAVVREPTPVVVSKVWREKINYLCKNLRS